MYTVKSIEQTGGYEVQLPEECGHIEVVMYCTKTDRLISRLIDISNKGETNDVAVICENLKRWVVERARPQHENHFLDLEAFSFLPNTIEAFEVAHARADEYYPANA